MDKEQQHALKEAEVNQVINAEGNKGYHRAIVFGLVALFAGYGAKNVHPNEVVQAIEAIITVPAVVASLYGLSSMHNANRARLQQRIDNVRNK